MSDATNYIAHGHCPLPFFFIISRSVIFFFYFVRYDRARHIDCTICVCHVKRPGNTEKDSMGSPMLHHSILQFHLTSRPFRLWLAIDFLSIRFCKYQIFAMKITNKSRSASCLKMFSQAYRATQHVRQNQSMFLVVGHRPIILAMRALLLVYIYIYILYVYIFMTSIMHIAAQIRMPEWLTTTPMTFMFCTLGVWLMFCFVRLRWNIPKPTIHKNSWRNASVIIHIYIYMLCIHTMPSKYCFHNLKNALKCW